MSSSGLCHGRTKTKIVDNDDGGRGEMRGSEKEEDERGRTKIERREMYKEGGSGISPSGIEQ